MRKLSAALRHWPEYSIEALGLGVFMLSAVAFGVLLEGPTSPVRAAIPSDLARRMLMGLAMGATAIGIVYSPFGQRSGAHINPAVTLTFWRLGKIAPRDALGYVIAQFVGGAFGLWLGGRLLGSVAAHPAVHYVATVPGEFGVGVAFLAEVAISFGMMTMVLAVSNRKPIARYTGLCAGALIALYISFEAPLSGMSMNPARTVASAIGAGDWRAIWIYFTAPLLGMVAAAEVHTRCRATRVRCAKLHHDNDQPCIFRCGWGDDTDGGPRPALPQ